MYEKKKDKKKTEIATSQDWTADLLITSQMHYHCAKVARTSYDTSLEFYVYYLLLRLAIFLDFLFSCLHTGISPFTDSKHDIPKSLIRYVDLTKEEANGKPQ